MNDKCGIYSITNIVNMKKYIGSSIRINKRWKQHEGSLKRNNHQNQLLQNAYNKYGIENFMHEIILECDRAKLLEEEERFITLLKTLDRNYGYNIESPTRPNQSVEANEKRRKTMTGRKMSEAQKLLFSKIRKGVKQSEEHKKAVRLAMQNRSEEDKQKTYKKISESQKDKIVSAEVKKKISQKLKGRTMSAEWRRKMSESHMGIKNANFGKTGKNHQCFGISHSMETRKKMSDAHKGDKNHNFGKVMSEAQKRKISESQKKRLANCSSAP